MASAENETVHEQNRELLAQLFAKPDAGPDDFKRVYEEFLAGFEVPGDASFEEVDADGVPCIWASAPGVSTDRAIVFFHSGGYVIGSARGYRQLGARLSAAAGVRVLLVDYRLAPAHPFPAPVEDALTAYRWLRGQGLSAGSIVVGGDSAGGGLTMITLQQLRDAGEELPAAGLCFSPWTDMAVTGESVDTNAEADPLIDRGLAEAMAGMYLADTGADPRDPKASPLYGDFAGLPPLLIVVGTIECLRDDARRCAERAEQAGVDVTYEEGEDMVHIWPIFADRLPEARETIERAGRFVKERLGAGAGA